MIWVTEDQGSGFSDYAGICEEARTAKDDLFNMVWRVNYLVERDGVTPCTSKEIHVQE